MLYDPSAVLRSSTVAAGLRSSAETTADVITCQSQFSEDGGDVKQWKIHNHVDLRRSTQPQDYGVSCFLSNDVAL
jgi:hypothetical protein